ncbi:hypothetical protein [Streptomyces wuyuanensis]|uniref:hypothetical protein n=1 Tax=Streptomyces wuyuanensis TaxID=1196353 RepID=UPI0037B8036F
MDNPNLSRREALCAWLTANEINPGDIPTDGDLIIHTRTDGTRVIRYEVFVRDTAGLILVDDRGARTAIESRETPLIVEPPDWWRPFQKPTREQLLATVQRVRALHAKNPNTGDCEHCSERDYPNYAVPWPCRTLQVVEEQQTSTV